METVTPTPAQAEDLKYLRKNTLQIANVITYLLILIIIYVAILAKNFQGTRLTFSNHWLIATAIFLVGNIISARLRQQDRVNIAAITLIAGFILAVDITLLETGAIETFLPYLFLLGVAGSGLLISPFASLLAALGCIFSSFGLLLITFGLETAWLMAFIPPAILSVLMALVTWSSAENLTTAYGWAVNSQQRAQLRRDELFESQQALQQVNYQLEAANLRLAEAQTIAEEANTTKTKFISNLSHELRTPLNAIITFSYILAQTKPGSSPPDSAQLNYLKRIQEAGEHLLSIVNDLLDLAKIEAGQMDVYIEPTPLNPIIERVLQLTEGLLENKSIELMCHMPEKSISILADGSRVQQIMFNLLSNATKYTNDGQITIQTSTDDDQLIIAIADTGIGIQEAELENIFKEFHQTEAARRHKRRGTGLGLPISKKFVEMQNGKIWVESQVGVGSTFYFSLPLAISKLESSPIIQEEG